MKNVETINVTFSLPKTLKYKLQSFVGKGELSKFASEALEAALEVKMQSLRADYSAAENDASRREELEDWSVLDLEGLDE